MPVRRERNGAETEVPQHQDCLYEKLIKTLSAPPLPTPTSPKFSCDWVKIGVYWEGFEARNWSDRRTVRRFTIMDFESLPLMSAR